MRNIISFLIGVLIVNILIFVYVDKPEPYPYNETKIENLRPERETARVFEVDKESEE